MKKILVVVMMLFVVGCGGGRRIKSFDYKVTDSQTTQASVKEAILKVGNKSHWKMTAQGDDVIMAKLNVRGHVVQVKITYDKAGYSISYSDSENMKYNQERGTIHKKYNKWVSRLNQQIQNHL